MSEKTEEKKVIQGFIDYLCDESNIVRIAISFCPDEIDRENEAIDAIAEGSGLKLAIEHTSVDSYPGQRMHDARFHKIITSVKDELQGEFDDYILLGVSPSSIPKGSELDKLKPILRSWLKTNIPKLPYCTKMEKHYVTDLPFPISVYKRKSEQSMFYAPGSAPDLAERGFEELLSTKITKKLKKLMPYKDRGYTTILLIENKDIAFMNTGIMIEGVAGAMAMLPEMTVDKIWYADTSLQGLNQDAKPKYRQVWPLKQ